MGSTVSKPPQCMKETWIQELPNALFFSINRVSYDVKQKILVKNFNRFDFEKIVYADKFMYNNRAKDEEVIEQVKKLRAKQT